LQIPLPPQGQRQPSRRKAMDDDAISQLDDFEVIAERA